MEKVGIGIVGSKFAADFHCDSYSRNENAELVSVCIPNFLHHQVVAAAAKAGATIPWWR